MCDFAFLSLRLLLVANRCYILCRWTISTKVSWTFRSVKMMASAELKLSSQIHACNSTQPNCTSHPRSTPLAFLTVGQCWPVCQLPYSSLRVWLQKWYGFRKPQWGNPMRRECMEHLPNRLLQMGLICPHDENQRISMDFHWPRWLLHLRCAEELLLEISATEPMGDGHVATSAIPSTWRKIQINDSQRATRQSPIWLDLPWPAYGDKYWTTNKTDSGAIGNSAGRDQGQGHREVQNIMTRLVSHREHNPESPRTHLSAWRNTAVDGRNIQTLIIA